MRDSSIKYLFSAVLLLPIIAGCASAPKLSHQAGINELILASGFQVYTPKRVLHQGNSDRVDIIVSKKVTADKFRYNALLSLVLGEQLLDTKVWLDCENPASQQCDKTGTQRENFNEATTTKVLGLLGNIARAGNPSSLGQAEIILLDIYLPVSTMTSVPTLQISNAINAGITYKKVPTIQPRLIARYEYAARQQREDYHNTAVLSDNELSPYLELTQSWWHAVKAAD